MIGELAFAPILPWPVIAALGALGGALSLLALVRGGAGALWRLLATVLIVVAMFDPRLVREDREPQADVAVVLIDRTASQSVGERLAQTDAALAAIREQLKRFPNTELREATVRDVVPKPGVGADAEGTLMMRGLRRALGSVPPARLAGVIVIGDGQVHDMPPETVAELAKDRPIHVLLSGQRAEVDRRIVVEEAPAYGLVGKPVIINYRVEDRVGAGAGGLGNLARVTLREGQRVLGVAQIPVGRTDRFEVQLDHAGPTVLTLEVETVKGELSTVNNKTLVSINGVRDRLRVLLVSGQPHAGERTWRNLLKADPAVDLVHFTILRPPEKDDFTPLNEISLIAFPTRELFEIKLKEFDLVVFDRYVVRDVLPPSYLRNIDDYVKGGGALLLAVGPEFAGERSLFKTPLGRVLPAAPSGKVITGGYRPRVSEIGQRHPVTANLPGQGTPASDGGQAGEPRWGRWFRQIDAAARAGHTLMQGDASRPLLVLDRYGEGRVASVLSDHIWLWARGFEGGGPYAELLRRTAHWLMKEPDLEEDNLRAEVRAGKLVIQRRSLAEDAAEITVTHPDGRETKHALSADKHGLARAEVAADAVGLYRVSDGRREALAAAGAVNPAEFADLRATDRILEPVARHTGGGLHWIVDGVPDIRMVRPGRDRAGKDWLGLVENRAYVVSGVAETPLAPPLALILALLGAIMMAWWREGR